MLLSLTTALAAETCGTLLEADDHRLVVELHGAAELRPGERVSVYLSEPRELAGRTTRGLRYAGDADLSWAGDGLVELLGAEASLASVGEEVRLGSPTGGTAAPPLAWSPPEPEPGPLEEPAPHDLTPSGLTPDLATGSFGSESGTRAGGFDRGWRETVHERRAGSSQALAASVGFAGDGYDAGVGVGSVAWRLRPDRGPALVEVELAGLHAERWVQGNGDEAPAREPAVGYWLWTRVDGAGTRLAPLVGLAAGVEQEGLGTGWLLGLRTGHPDGSYLETAVRGWGSLGQRGRLEGRIALSDELRVGVRARAGALPTHDGDFLQDRADGVLVVDWDPLPLLGLELAAGAGGYDWLLRDAGLAADASLEVRW